MKYFISKFLLCVGIILGAQIAISSYILPQVPEISALQAYLTHKYKVIYFGDSIIHYTAPDDTDTSSIIDYLSQLNQSYPIGDVSHSAYDLGVYEAMMEYISHSKNKPKAVIIPVSLRSFSPEWDQRPFYQFEKEKFILTNHVPFLSAFYKPLAVFHAINLDPISQQQFLKTPVYDGTTQIGTVADFEDDARFSSTTPDNIKAKYVYSYMEELRDTQRKIISLEHILGIGREQGIKVFIYITPIDYQGGARAVGSRFIPQTKANSNLICSLVSARGDDCLNLAFSLPSADFTHPAYPSEHLRASGRLFVAQQIESAFLKSL